MDENTKNEWLSWIRRAINDYRSAEKLFSGKDKYLDIAVFHCQQSVEKILKSFLVYNEIKFEKVHSGNNWKIDYKKFRVYLLTSVRYSFTVLAMYSFTNLKLTSLLCLNRIGSSWISSK
jgi:hypothetical protein